MRFPLLPAALFDRLSSVRPEWIQTQGIRLVLLDFDNTICPYTNNIPEKDVIEWFDRVQASGISICVVSNSKKPRVPVFCEKYGIPFVVRARKPGGRGIREAMQRFSIEKEQTMLIGDQIYTDTLAANLAGILPVLVKPISLHILPLRVRHWLELPWIAIAKAKGRKNS